MPIPTWSVGQVLTASDVDSWFVPLAVVKTADQSVTSSTTLVNDSQLVLAVPASTTYMVHLFLNYEGGTQGSSDLKVQFQVPSGAALTLDPHYVDTSGGFHTGNNVMAGVSLIAGTNGAGTPRNLTGLGTLTVASTAGNFQMQWAQNTNNGTATIIHANSWLVLRRLA